VNRPPFSGRFSSRTSGYRSRVSAGAAVSTAAIRGGLATRVVPALLVGGVLLGLISSQGGFFATSWGWSSLVLLLGIAVVLVLRDALGLGRVELAFIGLLAALTAWTALSALWSGTAGTSLVEAQRTFLFVAVAAIIVLTVRAGDVSRYLLVVLSVITIVSLYALLTRCWPARYPLVHNLAGYRLARPIGYWNGLGILVAAGAVLALGFVAGYGPRAIRSSAAALSVPLVLTLYFTFSRAGWIALAFGILVAMAVTRERLRFVGWTAVAGVAPTLAVVAAMRLRALSTLQAGASAAAHDGLRLAVLTPVLAVVAVGLTLTGFACEKRIDVSRRGRRQIGALLVIVVVGGAAATLVAIGRTPASLASRAYDSFIVPRPTIRGNLDQRLLSFSGNGRIELWRTAWRDYRAHPLLGSGAGTYARAWAADPKADFPVQDAHGLYIETLGELGPVGLALLLGAVLLPLAVTLRGRARPAVAGAAGAYAAYLLHAGVDWDWELAGLTAVVVAIGALLLVERRSTAVLTPARWTRPATVAVVVVLALVVAAAYAGNSALARAGSTLGHHRYAKAAADATRAARLMPWSAAPHVLLGEVALGQGALPEARVQLRKALTLDDGDWQTWLDLALASRGASRSRALERASELYPSNPQIKRLQEQRGSSG
jgi:hypothetical protein